MSLNCLKYHQSQTYCCDRKQSVDNATSNSNEAGIKRTYSKGSKSNFTRTVLIRGLYKIGSYRSIAEWRFLFPVRCSCCCHDRAGFNRSKSYRNIVEWGTLFPVQCNRCHHHHAGCNRINSCRSIVEWRLLKWTNCGILDNNDRNRCYDHVHGRKHTCGETDC